MKLRRPIDVVHNKEDSADG